MIGALLWWLLCVSGPASADESQPVILAENTWSSQIVLSYVTGNLLERMGFRVVYRPSDIYQQFFAMEKGLLHVQMEVWQGSMEQTLNLSLDSGLLVSAGYHDAKTREDWWYPDHVADLCPGLPDWRALNECAKLFATEDSKGVGVVLMGPWTQHEEGKIRALKLNYKIVAALQPEAVWIEMVDAVQRRQPILVYNWTPNSIEHYFSGAFVEFPPFDPDCYNDPTWGVNPEAAYDCGNPNDGWIKKVVSAELVARRPCAFNLIKNIVLTQDDFSSMAALIDFEGFTKQDAAAEWLRRRPDKVAAWLPADCEVVNGE